MKRPVTRTPRFSLPLPAIIASAVFIATLAFIAYLFVNIALLIYFPQSPYTASFINLWAIVRNYIY